MTAPIDFRSLARAGLLHGQYTLVDNLIDGGLNVTDNAVWRPAKRAFLEALIREAQLELARNDLPPDVPENQFRMLSDAGNAGPDGVRRAWCMGSAPHAGHEFNGGAWCPGLTEEADETG